MFREELVLIFGLLAVVWSDDKISDVPSVKKCYGLRNGVDESAYQKGCKFAYALTFASKDYAHNPTCLDSCKDSYSDAKEIDACKQGCANYEDKVATVNLLPTEGNSKFENFIFQRASEMHDHMRKMLNELMGNRENSETVKIVDNNDDGNARSFFDRARSKVSAMIQRMRSLVSGPTPVSQVSEKDDSDDEPVLTSRVRFFFFSRPEVDTDEARLIRAKNAEPMDGAAKSHWMSGTCRGVMHTACRVLSNPFNLLLAFTLFALIVLFITQLVLFVRRRPRRARGFEYTRLPTYAEAVEIKIPLDAQDCVLKPQEKSALANEEVNA